MPDNAVPESRRSLRWIPLLLLLLALNDLRTELRLLADHITVTSLVFTLRHHTLAVVVLVLQPSLWSRYRLRQRQRH